MGIIKTLDHVAIGVDDIDKARQFLCDVLGAVPKHPEKTVHQEGFVFQAFALGGHELELVTPVVPREGGVGRYIAEHGEGLHHLSMGVENAQESMKFFESKGIRILGTSSDKSEWRYYYLHPADTFGALIQIYEEWTPEARAAFQKAQSEAQAKTL